MEKFFRILKDTKFCIAESIVDESGLIMLRALISTSDRYTGGNELADLKFEKVNASEVTDYYFVSSSEIAGDDSSGEKNVFHDSSGNEYHN